MKCLGQTSRPATLQPEDPLYGDRANFRLAHNCCWFFTASIVWKQKVLLCGCSDQDFFGSTDLFLCLLIICLFIRLDHLLEFFFIVDKVPPTLVHLKGEWCH